MTGWINLTDKYGYWFVKMQRIDLGGYCATKWKYGFKEKKKAPN